jgi:hypothetical protein
MGLFAQDQPLADKRLASLEAKHILAFCPYASSDGRNLTDPFHESPRSFQQMQRFGARR